MYVCLFECARESIAGWWCGVLFFYIGRRLVCYSTLFAFIFSVVAIFPLLLHLFIKSINFFICSLLLFDAYFLVNFLSRRLQFARKVSMCIWKNNKHTFRVSLKTSWISWNQNISIFRTKRRKPIRDIQLVHLRFEYGIYIWWIESMVLNEGFPIGGKISFFRLWECHSRIHSEIWFCVRAYNWTFITKFFFSFYMTMKTKQAIAINGRLYWIIEHLIFFIGLAIA